MVCWYWPANLTTQPLAVDGAGLLIAGALLRVSYLDVRQIR